MQPTRTRNRSQNRIRFAAAAAAAAAAVPLIWAPQVARAGVTFNTTASTVKWTFAADLNNTTTNVQQQSVNPAPASGSMPAPPTYQINKTFTSGSSNATGKGSIGYVTNSTTASFTLASGSGASQNDPTNVFTGASSLKCDFDGRFDPTSPGFGPPATGYVSVLVGGTVGVGGYTRFIGQIQFINGLTNAALRTTVNFDQTFNVAGPFSQTFTSSATLSPSTIPVGTPVKVKGFFQFLASNQLTPSDITPIDLEFAAAPPTATWYVNGDGNWNDPTNWAPPAGAVVDDPGGTIPSVPNSANHRARFINIFSAPHTINLNAPITLGTMQVDSAANLNIAGTAANSLNFDVTSGQAVIQVKNTSGGNGVILDTPVQLSDSVQVVSDMLESAAEVEGPGSAINFAQQVSGSGAMIKMGSGTAILSAANTFTGGTEARGGYLNANVTGSLSNGPVLADDGQLNYNAIRAAAGGVVVTSQHNGQIALAVDPPQEHFALNDLGAISANASLLQQLIVGGNLQLSPGAMIGHQTFDTGSAGNPQGLFGVPGANFVFGIASNIDLGGTAQSITVGSTSGTPWRGFGGDRRDRAFGTATDDPAVHLVISGNAELDSLHNSLSINHAIGGAGAITKRGGGIVAINNNANPFAGTMAVESGALLVNGHLNNVTQTTVQSGGTLGGVGVLGGNVTVQNGGHLSPGRMRPDNLIGTFTINGNLSMSPSSFLDIDLDAAGVNDFTMVNGALTLDGILNVNALENFLPGSSYTLFQTTGAITDNGLVLGFAPDQFAFSVLVQQPNGANPGTVMITTAIPEPGAALGMVLLTSALIARQRRRN